VLRTDFVTRVEPDQRYMAGGGRVSSAPEALHLRGNGATPAPTGSVGGRRAGRRHARGISLARGLPVQCRGG
ncbi:MAG TPA: hypothetical protein VGL09_19860, partial [Methylomirabilota bacterium]